MNGLEQAGIFPWGDELVDDRQFTVPRGETPPCPVQYSLGIGVREGAGVLLFGLVGVERAQAFSLQFTTYLVSVAVSLLGGLIFLARMPYRRAEARQSGRTSG